VEVEVCRDPRSIPNHLVHRIIVEVSDERIVIKILDSLFSFI
jgi:hypothetical protein